MSPTEAPAKKRKSCIPLCVGYSMTDENQMPFDRIVSAYRDSIGEVYFPFIGIASGRSPLGDENGWTDYSAIERLIPELCAIADMGIALDLLFNAACDGDDALSIAHKKQIESVIDYLTLRGCQPQIVTTASPVTARIVKEFDPSIRVRASVNMRITTVKGIRYVEEFFDSFCIGRDINRDLPALREVSDYLHAKNKEVILLANSGCLRNCSMQSFHDNAVAHEAGIRTKANLPGISAAGCHEFLRKPENHAAFLQNTWVRPEDIRHYAGIADGIKLATRMHALPAMVIDAYARENYSGNLADLFEPGHGPTFAPWVIDNDRFPADWFEKTTACDKQCHKCSYCESVRSRVFIKDE